MIGILGLVLSLIFVMISVFRGWHIIPVSFIAGLFVILTNQLEIWSSFSVSYSTGLSGYVGSFFIIFILGAFFGEVMSVTGSAKSMSYKLMDTMGVKRAPLALVIATLLLTYGGVNSFIVVFALYPISVVLFNEAKLPRRILTACIFLGLATITQSSFPGTPSIQNLIPADYFKTPTTAAPLIGVVASIIFFVVGMGYINWQIKIARKNNEVFVPIPADNLGNNADRDERDELPDWKIAIMPVVTVITLILGLSRIQPALYAVSIGLTGGIILTYILNWKRIKNPVATMSKGCVAGVIPLLNTSAIVAYASIVRTAPAFQSFIDLAMSLQFHPYVVGALGVNIVAGITGSSSGGLRIFLENMGEFLLNQGINAEAMHRILSIASGGLDTLPHNGAVVTILTVLGTSHKESYKDVGIICVLLPIIVTVIAVILGIMLY
jgi:H+/gluconate symporter-like permease